MVYAKCSPRLVVNYLQKFGPPLPEIRPGVTYRKVVKIDGFNTDRVFNIHANVNNVLQWCASISV